MLGSVCGVSNLEAVIKANYLCDELGIDTISTGNIIGFVMECYEKGIIGKDDLDGIEAKWGSEEALIALIEKIGLAEGVGKLLAEGVKKLAEKWNKGAEKFAMHAKGLEQSAYDTRSAPSMALAYATADVGAHHNRAWTIYKDITMGEKWTLEDRVDIVIFHQHVRPMFDALGVCRLPWIELEIPLEFYAKAYTAATGIETTIDELLKRSEGIYNITRAINVRRGIRRKDDYPPDRVFEDPVLKGSRRGNKLSREEYEKLLDLYYEKRGWNKEGVPTEEKLRELGLDFIIGKI